MLATVQSSSTGRPSGPFARGSRRSVCPMQRSKYSRFMKVEVYDAATDLCLCAFAEYGGSDHRARGRTKCETAEVRAARHQPGAARGERRLRRQLAVGAEEGQSLRLHGSKRGAEAGCVSRRAA